MFCPLEFREKDFMYLSFSSVLNNLEDIISSIFFLDIFLSKVLIMMVSLFYHFITVMSLD